jgi:hypothetical protein
MPAKLMSQGSKMEPNVPPHWVKGQLLNLMRFHDGSFIAVPLGEDYDASKANGIHFDSSFDAQQFISAWYTPDQQRFG